MWWKRHKWKVIVPAAVLAVLAVAFWYGGDAPGLRGWPEVSGEEQSSEPSAPVVSLPEETLPEQAPPPDEDLNSGEQPPQEAVPPEEPPAEPSGQPAHNPPEAGKPDSAEPSAPPPEDSAEPDPQEPAPPEGDFCTLSVGCHAVFDHLDWLAEGKEDILPEDGWIFPETQVAFTPGESVFDLLQREMKNAGIPMEFSNTPMYQSAYIEGIANLYEFDCGELSGWLYLVNGEQFGYGSSRRLVEPGDQIQWVYTCDRGLE